MEGLSVKQQVQLLSTADVLVSPHGGALTNMVFCRPGIKVLELFGRRVYPFYYGLAQTCGHDYYAILENGDDYSELIQIEAAAAAGAPERQKATREMSFDVSVQHLTAMLEKIG